MGGGGGGKLSIENTNFLLFDKTGKKLGTIKEGKKVYSKWNFKNLLNFGLILKDVFISYFLCLLCRLDAKKRRKKGDRGIKGILSTAMTI